MGEIDVAGSDEVDTRKPVNAARAVDLDAISVGSESKVVPV